MKPGDPQNYVMTIQDVSAYLKIPVSTVYEWARIDYIPHIHLGVGKTRPLVRFSMVEVQQWVKDKATEGRTKRVPDIS